jgi:hypothetical protein
LAKLIERRCANPLIPKTGNGIGTLIIRNEQQHVHGFCRRDWPHGAKAVDNDDGGQ